MSAELLTAKELAPLLKRTPDRIRIWKRTGIITAEVDTGRNILFDLDTVRKQLAKRAKQRLRKSAGKESA